MLGREEGLGLELRLLPLLQLLLPLVVITHYHEHTKQYSNHTRDGVWCQTPQISLEITCILNQPLASLPCAKGHTVKPVSVSYGISFVLMLAVSLAMLNGRMTTARNSAPRDPKAIYCPQQ